MTRHNDDDHDDSRIDAKATNCPRCGVYLKGPRCRNCGFDTRNGPQTRCYECGERKYEVEVEVVMRRSDIGVPTSKPVCDDCRSDTWEGVTER